MALVLLLSVPASLLRTTKAVEKLTGAELILRTGVYGEIYDRDGTVLYQDGKCIYDVLQNTVGSYEAAGNCLVRTHGREMKPMFNALTGKASGEGGRMYTTLIAPQSQQAIAEAFGKASGAVFAYNYETGEIYCALSVDRSSAEDGEQNDGVPPGTFLGNRCFDGRYIPGSTMKVVAAICAEEQNPGLLDHVSHRCEGVTTLSSGGEVECENAHGIVDFNAAMGYSCNGAFAEDVIGRLDTAKARQTLKNLGFYLTDENAPDVRAFGEQVKTVSATRFLANTEFESVWSLIGQGQSEVNLMDMAKIIGAVANHGEAADPIVVRRIDKADGGVMKNEPAIGRLISEAASDDLDARMTKIAERYYREGDNCLDPVISYAKTGTAQTGTDANRLLLGVSKDKKTAFIIVVEDIHAVESVRPAVIANIMIQYIPEPEEVSNETVE